MAEKTIVLTMYGKDDSVESFSISLFDRNELYYSTSKDNAINYCDNINDIELKDGKWIYASIIAENKKIILEKPPKFDIVNKLDDRALQKVLREISGIDLAKAMVECNDETKEKIFKNISKRAARILKEDMEALNDVTVNEVKLSQEKIVEIINKLTNSGEIVFARV
ncbi:MAG: hypothetical protein LBL45_00950 [Treponema sp.]|jgi:Mg/Co/Ni transporter MgtE|nr:hypothetical protein [Treponema sp.]